MSTSCFLLQYSSTIACRIDSRQRLAHHHWSHALRFMLAALLSPPPSPMLLLLPNIKETMYTNGAHLKLSPSIMLLTQVLIFPQSALVDPTLSSTAPFQYHILVPTAPSCLPIVTASSCQHILFCLDFTISLLRGKRACRLLSSSFSVSFWAQNLKALAWYSAISFAPLELMNRFFSQVCISTNRPVLPRAPWGFHAPAEGKQVAFYSFVRMGMSTTYILNNNGPSKLPWWNPQKLSETPRLQNRWLA